MEKDNMISIGLENVFEWISFKFIIWVSIKKIKNENRIKELLFLSKIKDDYIEMSWTKLDLINIFVFLWIIKIN